MRTGGELVLRKDVQICRICDDCPLFYKIQIKLSRLHIYLQFAIKSLLAFLIFSSITYITILLYDFNEYNLVYYVGIIGAIAETLRTYIFTVIGLRPSFIPKEKGALIVLTSSENIREDTIRNYISNRHIKLSDCDFFHNNIYVINILNKEIKDILSILDILIKKYISDGQNISILYYRLLNPSLAFIIGRWLYRTGYTHQVYHREGCIYSASRIYTLNDDYISKIFNKENLYYKVSIIKFNDKINLKELLSDITNIDKISIDFIDEKTLILVDTTTSEIDWDALRRLYNRNIINKILLIEIKPKDLRRRLSPYEILMISYIITKIIAYIYRSYRKTLNISFKTASAIAHYIGLQTSYIGYNVFIYNPQKRMHDVMYSSIFGEDKIHYLNKT